MNTYRLHITSNGADALYELKYQSGHFKSVRHIRGKLSQVQHEKLMLLCPQLEGGIFILKKEYEGRVNYSIQESKATLFTQMLDTYVEWYQDTLQIPPKIDGVSAKALKGIISFLASQCANEQEILVMWDVILKNWNQLDKFYQNQRELRQINSNFNILIAQIKHGKSTGNTQNKRAASNASHDFREGI